MISCSAWKAALRIGGCLSKSGIKSDWNDPSRGRLELSNNRAERSVRPFAVGRKNWLFSNTPKGADASAAVYSIVETAKANGLRPFPYLKFLLDCLSCGVPAEACLPWNESVRS